jgi:transposase
VTLSPIRRITHTLTQGKDAAQIPGLTDLTLMQLLSEIGLDMSSWPSAKHFTSWLGLSPLKN